MTSRAPPPAPNELGGSLEGDPRKRAARQLVATPLFGRLPARALRRLIEAVRLVRLAEGEVLFRQGDPADALYVVADGAVVPIAEGETRRKLSVLEAGEFFGEIALVTDQPRNATVEALVDSELLAIDHQVIRTLLDEEPEMLAASLRFLRQRLVDRLLRTSELFASFDHRERARIARSFRLMEVQPDSVLIEQGLPADALHLVLAGELRVVTETADGAEAKEIAILRAGDPCGEMSLLAREPAMATVVASRRSWVLLLPRSDFDAVLDAHPGLREPLTCIAEARDSATDAAQRVADLELV
jgi:CRP-like cAMP-binding protein